MPFATTKHLNLRPWRESDKDSFLAQENDVRVQRTTSPTYVVPQGGNRWKTLESDFLSKVLLLVIVEVKKEYAGLRKWDEGEERKKDEDKTQEDWDRELFAGWSSVNIGLPKNRESYFGIALNVQWWGNGLATEVTEWMVQHAFEQLNVHRITLGVFANNAAAKRVYDKCGFVQEGLARKVFWLDGEWVDEIRMGILDEDYWTRKKELAMNLKS